MFRFRPALPSPHDGNRSPDLLGEGDPISPEPGNGSRRCISCGSPLSEGAVACAACGALVRSRRRALSPPAGFLGGVLGVFAGPAISLVAGFIGYVSVGWAANRIAGTQQWAAVAAFIGIQVVPVVAALALGTLLLRTGRPQFGWFLVITGIMAFLPAAACDIAVIATQPR